jgi:multidrug resistance efflux pump
MVGAPLFRIRPDQQALVDTYLTGDQLTKVRLGTLADITYDSGDGAVLHGRLHLIDDQALYPPTSFPTNVVHMTDTVKLTFQLDSGANPPPQGTPVDIAIHTD